MLRWLGIGRRPYRNTAIFDDLVDVHRTEDTPVLKLDYLPLSTSTDEIRLLTILPSLDSSKPISCRLEHKTFGNKPSYEALSYTWGNPNGPKPTVYVDDKPMTVRENLWLALKSIRDRFSPRVLWVDAVCIDQSSIEERNRQVRLMPFIYRRATKVLVWLGIDDPDVSNVLLKLESNNLDAIKNDVGLRLQMGLLCKRDYWSRLWIIQEIEMAADILVCCGLISIDWNTFIKAVEMCRSLDISVPLQMAHSRQDRYGNSHLLANLLRAYQFALCEDPRDKVFGLVGLATDIEDESTLVDYSKSALQVFREVVWFQYYSHIHFHDVVTNVVPGGDSASANIVKFAQLVYSLFEPSFTEPIHPEPLKPMPAKASNSIQSPIRLKADLMGTIDHIGLPHSKIIGSFERTKEWTRTVLLLMSNQNTAFARAEIDKFIDRLLRVKEPTLKQLVPLTTGFSWLCQGPFSSSASTPKYMSRFQPLPWAYDRSADSPESNSEPRLFFAGLFMMGLAPHGSRIGDTICLLRDEPITLILRKVGDRYIIVGRALVYGTNMHSPGLGVEEEPSNGRYHLTAFIPGVYVDIDTLALIQLPLS